MWTPNFAWGPFLEIEFNLDKPASQVQQFEEEKLGERCFFFMKILVLMAESFRYTLTGDVMYFNRCRIFCDEQYGGDVLISCLQFPNNKYKTIM